MFKTIQELIASAGLHEYRCELNPNDDYPVYTLHVPRSMVDEVKDRLLSVGLSWGSVRVEQIAPALVPAEPGQAVLVYSEFCARDELSPIGVVTSVQEIDGRTAYGCSYVQLSLGDAMLSDLYPIHMSAEDYGGYHSGFLKVIEPDELTALLRARVEAGHRAALDRVAALRARSEQAIPGLVAMLAKGTVEQMTRWGVGGDDRIHEVNMQLPNRYPPPT